MIWRGGRSGDIRDSTLTLLLTERGEKQKKIDDDFENPLVHSGYSMVVWEDPKREEIWFANRDRDAVRI